MYRLLALDQASVNTGWSVFEDGKLIDHGVIRASAPDVGTRLVEIREEIADLVKHYQITNAIFEDIQLQKSMGNNVITYKVLAEVFGVIHEYFEEIQLPYSTVLASSWKSSLGIKGRNRPEQKRAAQEYVEKELNIKATQDEIDSICIGLYFVGKNK